MARPVRRAGRTARLALGLAVGACGGEQASPPAREAPVAPSAAPRAAPAVVERPPAIGLDAYLAAIPSEPPELSEAVTGRPGHDASVSIERCRDTGWSFVGCSDVYPVQGLQWVRFECAHGEDSHHRSILCNRLAEYLRLGIGGPADPALADEMFARQCDTRQVAYRHNCYAAAELLMFDQPTRAREYIRRGCDSPDESPGGCAQMRPLIEAGVAAREFVVEKVAGLDGVAVGDVCELWLWRPVPGTCGARMVCGEAAVYGAHGSSLPCDERGGANDDRTSAQDSDPSLALAGDRIDLADDETGLRGAFTLRAALRRSP